MDRMCQDIMWRAKFDELAEADKDPDPDADGLAGYIKEQGYPADRVFIVDAVVLPR